MKIQPTVNFYEPLQANHYYHLYNRTNNKELLFRNDENRKFFLRQYAKYIHPFVKTYAYCLLPNHFHFLICVKEFKIIDSELNSVPPADLTFAQNSLLEKGLEEEDIPLIIQHQFRRFFISYSTAFNRMWKRKGNLLNRRFKRLEINNEEHFTNLIYYIHVNPVGHKISDNYKNYDWSSYKSLISDKPTRLDRLSVMDWFGGKSHFSDFHSKVFDDYLENRYAIEGTQDA